MNRFVYVSSSLPLPGAAVEFLDATEVDERSSRATRHVAWTDAAESVWYRGWEDGPGSSTLETDGLRAVAGTPRPRRGTWSPTAPFRNHLRTVLETFRRQADDICDAFVVVRIAPDGEGFVGRDPLGVHPLYAASTSTAAVVGNRADLVAQVLGRLSGTRIERDVRAAAWLSFSGFVMDTTSGFRGVRVVGQDRLLRIRPGAIDEETTPPVWEDSGDGPIEAMVAADEIEADIAAALHHAVAWSPERPRLELTGGKDSRVVLAVARTEGLVPAFDMVTFGPDDLPDMRVARRLAAIAGGRHVDVTDEHYAAAAALGADERMRRHVHRTCGASYLGDANEPPPHGRLTTSGLLGEVFRTANRRERTAPPRAVADAVERFVTLRPLGDLGLLKPDAGASLLHTAAEFFVEAQNAVRGPEDLRPTHFLRRRVPGWQRPLVDHHQSRVLPFYSAGAFRLAYRLPMTARAEEVIHHELIRRAGAELLDVPFANDEWHGIGQLSPAPVTGTANVKQVVRVDEGGSLAAVFESFVDAVPDNPVFEVVDREAVRRAIPGVDRASGSDRRQILGALAGIIWLGGLDLPSRP